MDQVNFFGFGNESPRDAALESHGFYQIRQKQFNFHPLLDITLVGPVRAHIGGLFTHVSSVEDAPVVGGAQGFGRKEPDGGRGGS
jgi:hypothetical protein